MEHLETVWEQLQESGVLGPAASVLLAMLLAGGTVFLGVSLYLSYKKFRIQGSLAGVRTRKKIHNLRAQGKMEGEFTFADAVEVSETGTVLRKTLEDKIFDCVVPIEILFSGDEHGLVYQFEMNYRSEKEVASWVEVAKALNLAEISRVMEEIVAMRNVICHPEYDPEAKHGDEKIGDMLWRRASELHVKMGKINGVAELRAACEAHLRKNARDRLPLPTR